MKTKKKKRNVDIPLAFFLLSPLYLILFFVGGFFSFIPLLALVFVPERKKWPKYILLSFLLFLCFLFLQKFLILELIFLLLAVFVPIVVGLFLIIDCYPKKVNHQYASSSFALFGISFVLGLIMLIFELFYSSIVLLLWVVSFVSLRVLLRIYYGMITGKTKMRNWYFISYGMILLCFVIGMFSS